MMPYTPLGTLYAASFLQQRGYQPTFFDSMLADSEQEIKSKIEKEKPDVVVIYDDDFNYLTKMCLSRMRWAAFEMSKIAKQFGCTVVVHGSDAADHVDEYLDHSADYVIIGEGEISLSELMAHLENPKSSDITSISGLAYRTNGETKYNSKRSVLHHLDELPFPARHLVDNEKYRRLWKQRHGYFSLNMVTTRGCPFHCNWCAKPIYGQVYNTRSPENVVEEMMYIKKTFSPDQIWFCDDIFGLKPGWVQHFAEVIVKNNARMPFKCLSRADLLLKENAIENLAKSGCEVIWIGAESGSQKILDAMDKGTTVEQIYQASKLMKENNIRVGFFLQYGYPGETRSDIELTLQMIKDCKPDEIGISVSYPLPGTKFHERIKSQLGEKKNWVESQDLDLMFPGEFPPDFYRALHKVTHKRFRIWQGNDLIQNIMRSHRKISKKDIRQIAACAYHAITLPSFEMKMERLGEH